MGISTVCEFMRANQDIKELTMWGNPGLDPHRDDALVGESLASMLLQNDSLEALCVWPKKGDLSEATLRALIFSLTRNTALRVLGITAP